MSCILINVRLEHRNSNESSDSDGCCDRIPQWKLHIAQNEMTGESEVLADLLYSWDWALPLA